MSLWKIKPLSGTEVPGKEWLVGAELRFGGQWIVVNESHRGRGGGRLIWSSSH